MGTITIKWSWQDNGTKILGRFMWVIGFLGTADAVTINALAKLVGDKYAHFVGPVCLLCGGIATELRGRRNTTDIASAITDRSSVGDVEASARVVTDVAKTAIAAQDAAASVPVVQPVEKST